MISVVLELLANVVRMMGDCRLRSLRWFVEECFLACEKSRSVAPVSHSSHFLQS